MHRRGSATFVVALACALAGSLPVLSAARVARADEPIPPSDGDNSEDRQAAVKAFLEGQRAYGAGDYRHAADSFEAAYKLKPHPSALWNAARARQRAGDIARAANLFAKYLKEAPPSSKDRNTAQTALRQLSPKLGQLEIHAVGLEDIKVDRELVDTTTLYVNPGAHVVEARAGDRTVQQAQSVEAGQTESVALVAPTDPPPPVTPPPTPTPGPSPTDTTAQDHHGWSPAVVVVGGILTAVAGGVTIALGLVTTEKANDWKLDVQQNNKNNLTQANRDSGSAAEVRTNIFLGTTIGLAALTGVAAIWLVDWKGRDRHVQVGTTGNTMMLRGSF